MGNTCHCVEDRNKKNEMDLGDKKVSKNIAKDEDDESNVGPEGLEQEFNEEDEEL